MVNRSLGNTRRKCIDFIRIDFIPLIKRKYKHYLIWDEIIG